MIAVIADITDFSVTPIPMRTLLTAVTMVARLVLMSRQLGFSPNQFYCFLLLYLSFCQPVFIRQFSLFFRLNEPIKGTPPKVWGVSFSFPVS